MSQIVGDAARRAGLGLVHAHRLRHTAATEMLRAGCSLAEIGQVLRHRRALTTAIYAKVDEQALRALARPWPDGAARAASIPRSPTISPCAARSASGSSGRASCSPSSPHTSMHKVPTRSRSRRPSPGQRLATGAGSRWHAMRLTVVRGFAAHLHALDPVHTLIPPDVLPDPGGRATPYLYSDAEVAALMRAAAEPAGTPFGAATYATLIGLLAVAGLRVGEAIRLDQGDFDPLAGTLTIRLTKFGKSRSVPLHPTAVAALREYLGRDDRPRSGTPTAALFSSSTGTRLRYCVVHLTFQRLVRLAGLQARSAACRPRIHDLRHTFAVRTVLDAYQDDLDIGARLPVLSTYLGHVNPAATYWYLSAAPELLAAAGERLERHLGGRP